MKKKLTITFGMVVFLCALAMATVWVPATLAGNPGVEKLKIGIIGPMSGAGAAWGINMQRGAALACDDVNTAGGLKVGNKVYMLDFVSADTAYIGATAVSEVSRLIFQERIKYIFGPIGSTPCLAMQPIINENKVLHLHDSYTPKAVSPQAPYSFRAFCSTSHEIAPVVWGYAKEKYGVKTMVTIGQNDATGKAETDDDIMAAKTLGIKVLSRELFDLATTDFMPLMTKVVGMKPDAIEIGSAATGFCSEMIKCLYELGYKGIRVSNTLTGEAEIWVPIVGKKVCEGVISQNVDWSSKDATPMMRDLYKRYVTKFGRPFGAAAGWIYCPIMWFADAVNATGSLDTDVLKKYFDRPGCKYQHYYGEVQFGGKAYYGINHQAKIPVPVSEIRDGKNVQVVPPKTPPLELE